MTEQQATSQLCSLVSREANESIIGSARDVGQFLFMELERPWASKALQTEHLSEPIRNAYQEACKQGSFSGKFLPIAPDPEYSRDGFVRFLDYRRPDGPISTYEKTAYLVPGEEADAVARILLVEPDRREEITSFEEEGAPDREIMVCTHSERDPCCGHFGPPIHAALRRHYADDQLRAWQVSHIGGHRFCPNLIDLPDGRFWGRMELRELEPFVERSGGFEEIASRYRGWGALSSPEQLVEKAAFEREGWDWISYQKASSVSDEEEFEGRYRVAIRYQSENEEGRYTGIVEEAEPVQVLKSECGAETDDPSYKSAVQYRLVELNHET